MRQWAVGSSCGRLARIVVVLLPVAYCLLPLVASADDLDDLRNTLFERRQHLREVEQRIEKFRGEIAERQEQATTLRGQLRVIESSVTSVRLELDKTTAEIEAVGAEQDAVHEEVRQTEARIIEKRGQIRETLRLIQTLEADSVVEAFFKYPTLTGALVEARALERLEGRTHEALAQMKNLRDELQKKSTSLDDLERELKELKDRQQNQRQTLEAQQAAKQRLVEITRSQEAEFQKLLNTAAAQHRQAQAEIARVEAEVRAELERRGLIRLGGVGILDWPVDPLFGIACGFHCADYPYQRVLGPHTGIDIPSPVGTPVRAAAEGYVARAFDSGGPGYSYVLILHGDNLSTVYGHLSSINVSDGTFVTRGQGIGGTGGIPGMRGAGLSTGPHLHFEVRKKGIPVNPAAYLP